MDAFDFEEENEAGIYKRAEELQLELLSGGFVTNVGGLCDGMLVASTVSAAREHGWGATVSDVLDQMTMWAEERMAT